MVICKIEKSLLGEFVLNLNQTIQTLNLVKAKILAFCEELNIP